MKQLLSIPMQLVAVILAVFLLGSHIPVSVVSGFYSVSLIFKECLSLVLPFMVFFFVSNGIQSFKKNAPLVLAILLGTILCSNALVALLSYGVMAVLGTSISCAVPQVANAVDGIQISPLFSFSIPLPFTAVHALIAAVVIGLMGTFFSLPWLKHVCQKGKSFIESLIQYVFIPLLPLYVLGFLLKIHAEGMFSCIFQQYGSAFVVILAMQVIYLAWLYFFACGFSFNNAWNAIKIAFPSYLTAFSTMSSAAAIPISIESATRNTNNPHLSEVAMPIMANVHLLGDSIVTPILAMTTMLIFTGSLPAFATYISFVFYFCMAMFAVSGIPGGGILVMIPILKSQFGFNAEMVSVIMTIYFLLDAFGTGANVMGDGALVMVVNNILKRLNLAD